jgi:hypothetical protein
MPRTVGLPPSWFADSMVHRAFYVKMEFPSPIGTKRWTTKQILAGSESRDLEGSSETWDATKAWEPGTIEAGTTSVLQVNDVSFGNADNQFSDLAYLAGGVREVAITLWCVGFHRTTGADVGSFVLFAGRMDRMEGGEQIRVSIIPHKQPFLSPFPRRRFTTAFGFLWLPPPNFKIVWGSPVNLAGASDRQTNTVIQNPYLFPPPGDIEAPGRRQPPITVPNHGKPGEPPPRPLDWDAGPTHQPPTRGR